MQELFKKIDELAGIENSKTLVMWCERIAFVFLIFNLLSAPHSIAATQTAWLTGMFVWLVGVFITHRNDKNSDAKPGVFRAFGQMLLTCFAPLRKRSWLDFALWAFFSWSVVSSVFSYAPDISLDKLRNVALFLIFYFVIGNLRNFRAAKFLTFALIFSCMVNVLWTPVERILGRGVEIHGIRAESPLKKATLWEGDTLLKANDKKIKTPEDLVEEIKQNETTKVYFYRPDFYFSVDVKRADLLEGSNALESLGIESWKKSRNWRSQGFYGHYATYAEVLQLIISLVFGLFVALIGRRFLPQRRREKAEEISDKEAQGPKSKVQNLKNRFFPSSILLLLFCLIGMSFALLLTVTRASQLAFVISAFLIVLLNGNRKLLLILGAIALPVVIGGLFFLQQTREVGFFDRNDDSIKYRETVYREGFNLWTENPRHFMLGVGMDSIKRYKEQWHLFDNGKLPTGHFHSTPLQLLVERGLPALLLWLLVFGLYIKILLRGLRAWKEQNGDNSEPDDWILKGILLGCFGGAIGFFASSLVHYNLGDSEVAMVFFMLMGLGVFVSDFKSQM